MNQLELEKQQKRLRNWISMLSIFPSDSAAGKKKDELWGALMDTELQAVEQQLQINRGEMTANALISICNKLNALNYL